MKSLFVLVLVWNWNKWKLERLESHDKVNIHVLVGECRKAISKLSKCLIKQMKRMERNNDIERFWSRIEWLYSHLAIVFVLRANAQIELDKKQHKFSVFIISQQTKDFNARLKAEQTKPNWAFADIILLLLPLAALVHFIIRNWKP